MEENKTTYVLYLYNTGQLKSFTGLSYGKEYKSEGAAIDAAKKQFEQLRKIFIKCSNDKLRDENFRKMQVLVVEYTTSYSSRIKGILTDCAKQYTKIPEPFNTALLETPMV